MGGSNSKSFPWTMKCHYQHRHFQGYVGTRRQFQTLSAHPVEVAFDKSVVLSVVSCRLWIWKDKPCCGFLEAFHPISDKCCSASCCDLPCVLVSKILADRYFGLRSNTIYCVGV